MKWTCRRCGLQRDDRRGSGCSDVKGQAHDWVETEDYLNELSQWLWEKWLETTDGINYSKEKKRIEDEYGRSIEPIRNSDVFLRSEHCNRISKIFKKRRKIFVIILAAISIILVFLSKFNISILIIPLIPGITWLVFLILEKTYSNRSSKLKDKYMEMIDPYMNKWMEQEKMLEEISMNLINDFATKSNRMEKLNNKEASFVLKKLLAKRKGTEIIFKDSLFTYYI